MAPRISYDRGLIEIRNICMVKSEPGVYYDAHGNEVDPELARAVGFDVEKQVAERKVRDRMVNAETRIRREVKLEEVRATYEGAPPFRSGHKGGGVFLVYHFESPKEAVFEGRSKAEAESRAHDLNEALYRRMAGYDPSEESPATVVKSPVAGPADASSGGGDSSAGDGDDAS